MIGKCSSTTCRTIFKWNGEPLLKDAYCPYCGKKLEALTRDEPYSAQKVKFDRPVNICGKGLTIKPPTLTKNLGGCYFEEKDIYEGGDEGIDDELRVGT